jgi:hypothetical protein
MLIKEPRKELVKMSWRDIIKETDPTIPLPTPTTVPAPIEDASDVGQQPINIEATRQELIRTKNARGPRGPAIDNAISVLTQARTDVTNQMTLGAEAIKILRGAGFRV